MRASLLQDIFVCGEDSGSGGVVGGNCSVCGGGGGAVAVDRVMGVAVGVAGGGRGSDGGEDSGGFRPLVQFLWWLLSKRNYKASHDINLTCRGSIGSDLSLISYCNFFVGVEEWPFLGSSKRL